MHQSTLPCDFALPAEWEPQSAIMLTWPHAGTDWKPYLPEITDTYLELADIITRYEQLLVATPDVPATRYQLKKKLSAEQMSRVLLYEVESNDTWVRDHGPLTMVLRRKQNTWMVPYRILDFKFNGWGEKFRWEKDNAITLKLYYQAAFNADIENHQGFVLADSGSLDDNVIETLHVYDFLELFYQVHLQCAADATILERNERIIFLTYYATFFYKGCINIDFTNIVDDDGKLNTFFVS